MMPVKMVRQYCSGKINLFVLNLITVRTEKHLIKIPRKRGG